MNQRRIPSVLKAIRWRRIVTSITRTVTDSVTGRIHVITRIGRVDGVRKLKGYFLRARGWSQRYLQKVAGGLLNRLFALFMASSLALRKIME
jgi:uncharacterized membrane protein